LWATLRKNNFDIHVLESKAREAEDRLQMVTSQVQKVNLLTSMLLFIYSSGCGCYCRAFGDLRTNFRYCLHKTFFMFP
jgi:hypothetical protein